LANAESRLILAKMFLHYDLEIDHQQTPKDWIDQKAWAVFVKKHLYVKFTQAN
jgi:versicolorin B desaturase